MAIPLPARENDLSSRAPHEPRLRGESKSRDLVFVLVVER